MITPLSLRAALLEKQAGPPASKPGPVSSKPGVLPDAMPYMPQGPVRSPVQRRYLAGANYPSKYITRTRYGDWVADDNIRGGGVAPLPSTIWDQLPAKAKENLPHAHAYANLTAVMKDQYGGMDNLKTEIGKADAYNRQHGIPVHNSRYLNMRRVPVMWGAPAATRSVIPGKPGLIELPPNPRAGMAAWNMPEDMARYNGLAPGVFSGGDVLESLMHEGVHLVESSTYGSRKSELTRDGPRPVPSLLNTYPEHHPHELLPPGAAIQRWLYQTRGSRLESPEQYDDWIKSVGSYSEAQMQEAGMPQEVRRWLRYRNEASRGADGSPERLRYLDGNLRHLIPGLVQHTPSGAGLQKSAGQASGRRRAKRAVERVPRASQPTVDSKVDRKRKQPWWLTPATMAGAGAGIMYGVDRAIPASSAAIYRKFRDAMRAPYVEAGLDVDQMKWPATGDVARALSLDRAARFGVDYGTQASNALAAPMFGHTPADIVIATRARAPAILDKFRKSRIAGVPVVGARALGILEAAAKYPLEAGTVAGQADIRHYQDMAKGPLAAYHHQLVEYGMDMGGLSEILQRRGREAGLDKLNPGAEPVITNSVRDRVVDRLREYVNEQYPHGHLPPVEYAALPRDSQQNIVSGFGPWLQRKGYTADNAARKAIEASLGEYRAQGAAADYATAAGAGVLARRVGLALGGLLLAGGGYMAVRRLQQMRARREEERRKQARRRQLREGEPTGVGVSNYLRIPELAQRTSAGTGHQKAAGQAFTRALAFESITDEMADKYDFNSRKYYGITADELARYARIIARKMQHNLENGHRKLAGLSIRDVHEAGKVVPRNLSLKRRYSGSYPKGQVEWNGLRISIETPRGHWRIGKKPDGKLWFIKMRDPYGYFQRRAGYDGDSLDVFIGPRLRSPWVFVINQVDPKTGRFDEHKCVIGCSTAEEARRIYLRNYEPGWKGYGGSVRLHVSDFKRWASKAVDGAAEPQSKAAALGTRLGLHFYGQNPGVRL